MRSRFLWLFLLGWAGAVHGASFDCAKAATKVEKLVCADKDLSGLDGALADEYRASQLRNGATQALKAAQQTWLKSRRNACKDAGCLRSAYEARIAELKKTTPVFPDVASAIIGTCTSLATVAESDATHCTVIESGGFGQVGEAQQHYAVYCLDPPREEGRSCDLTAAALFSADPRSGRAERWLQSYDSEGLGNHFGKPELLQLKGMPLLLDLSVSVPGTGAFNASRLFRREGARWVEIDITSWEKDLAAQLPKGLEVWKGIWPDYRRMRATTGLYRKNDGNCCPTGGTANVTLKLEGNRLVLTGLKIGPPPK